MGHKVRYVIFDKETYKWHLVYCRKQNGEEATPEEIAKAMVSKVYHGKFSLYNAACVNSPRLRSDDRVFILGEGSTQYLWQIGGQFTDMEGFIVPDLYCVRKIGMIIED